MLSIRISKRINSPSFSNIFKNQFFCSLLHTKYFSYILQRNNNIQKNDFNFISLSLSLTVCSLTVSLFFRFSIIFFSNSIFSSFVEVTNNGRPMNASLSEDSVADTAISKRNSDGMLFLIPKFALIETTTNQTKPNPIKIPIEKL